MNYDELMSLRIIVNYRYVLFFLTNTLSYFVNLKIIFALSEIREICNNL